MIFRPPPTRRRNRRCDASGSPTIPIRARSTNRCLFSIPTATPSNFVIASNRPSTRRNPVPVPLRRISHVRIEVTDLDLARSWYSDTFGMVEAEQVPGEAQLTLTVPKSGQLLILRKVDQVAERSTQCFKGPHIDLRSNEEVLSRDFETLRPKRNLLGPRSQSHSLARAGCQYRIRL